MKEGIVMANGSVVVHDIDSLEKFGMELAARSAELESLYNALTVSCAATGNKLARPRSTTSCTNA